MASDGRSLAPPTSLVFDLGGVVVRWEPEAFLAEVYPDPSVRDAVHRELVRHDDWHELDRGTLTPADAVRRTARRAGLPETTVARFLDHVPAALAPDPEALALLRDLRGAGHTLFCLSNMHHAFVEHFEREHDFLDLFAGRVISCRVGLVKPERAIFEHLVAEHELAPAATVFVDDDPTNVAVAQSVGLRALRFEGVERCRRDLERMGCGSSEAGGSATSSASPASP